MDIKIDVSEARILKMAMEGMEPKQIEKEMAAEIRARVKQDIREQMGAAVEQLSHRDFDGAFTTGIANAVKAELLKVLTPTNIAKQFKKDEWSKLFEHVVEPVIVNFIEHALSEWLSLSVVVKGGKKEKSVELCGIDSYTHRKK
jgi:hypothetical protein